MSLPYMPLYIDDYEAATAHLSMLEDGAYCRLLRLCWRSPGCKIPNDEAWIMRKLRVSSAAETDAVRAILGEYFTTGRGKIWSKRLLAEHMQKSVSHSRRIEAGKIGGTAKSRKTKQNASSIATAMLKQPEPEPYPEKPIGFSERASAQKGSPRGWVQIRKSSDAAASLIEDIERHDEGRTQNGNALAGDALRLVSAVGGK